MFKTLHKISLRTRLVALTAVSVLALVIALLSAWRTAQTSETFARRQAEASVSNAVRELLREKRDSPRGATDAGGAKGKKLAPHEREIFARYNDSPSRSAAIALHRSPEAAGGFCQSDGAVLTLIVPENFGANLSTDERAAIDNLCRQIRAAQNSEAKQITVGDKFLLASFAPVDAAGESDETLASERISGAFAVRRISPALTVFGDWFSLLTQGFLLASVVGLMAFSFLTWRDWQSGMNSIETGLGKIGGDLRARISAPPMPELNRISGSINDLAANLDENLRRRKELEQAAIKNEKLAALGRVVAGVAHEVRNPLASMKLKIQLAARGKIESAKIEKTFGVLNEEIDRLDDLVKKLLDIARPAKMHFSEFSLADLIAQRLALVAENARAQSVRVAFDDKNEPAKIVADRDRLAQVFDNLFRNALEAMPSGGWLKVALEAESNFYRVRISDTGAGFSAEEREQLFEPFFTTKDRGTGLGLTISREIAEAHGGKIRLLSEAESGAALVVELPARAAGEK